MTNQYETNKEVEIVELKLDEYNYDDEVDSEEEEFHGLLSSADGGDDQDDQDNEGGRNYAYKSTKRGCMKRGALARLPCSGFGTFGLSTRRVMVLLGSLFLLKLLLGLHSTKSNELFHRPSHGHLNASASHGADGPLPVKDSDNTVVSVPYDCPASIGKADNDKDDIFDFYNVDTERHIHSLNMTVEELLNMKYGAWGITPNQRKALNAHWVHWYADALTLSSSAAPKKTIYESACGVGLTMYVNLELLQERHNITGLEVYGNEYIMDDVVAANHFYSVQQEQQHLHLRKGRICHGDSTNLTFVPSDSFDVVFTGYIDPIVDPLNLHLSSHEHKRYCQSMLSKDENVSEKQNKNQVTLMLQEQTLVEDWFAAWAGEMIRIAKPGGTIIVESISQPRCLVGDWGGVDKDWWAKVAVNLYGWSEDIDPAAIEIMDFDPAKHYKGIHDRYNVKMVKRLHN